MGLLFWQGWKREGEKGTSPCFCSVVFSGCSPNVQLEHGELSDVVRRAGKLESTRRENFESSKRVTRRERQKFLVPSDGSL